MVRCVAETRPEGQVRTMELVARDLPGLDGRTRAEFASEVFW